MSKGSIDEIDHYFQRWGIVVRGTLLRLPIWHGCSCAEAKETAAITSSYACCKAGQTSGAHALHRPDACYHFVPKQQASPRVVGAEDMVLTHEAAGAAALAEWNEVRLARAEVADYAFLISGLFVLVVLMACHGMPLLLTGLRNTHRCLIHDDALAHQRLTLARKSYCTVTLGIWWAAATSSSLK